MIKGDNWGRRGGETTGRQSLLKQKESQVPVSNYCLMQIHKGWGGTGYSVGFPLIAVTD